MSRVRRTGLYWMLLSSGISILWGISIAQNAGGMADFQAVYYGARCLVEHRDPYQEAEFLRVYQAAGRGFPADLKDSNLLRRAIPICINLPTALVLTVPFAICTWGTAHLLWLSLQACCIIIAAFLVWDLAGNLAPRVSLFLICVVLANCEVLLSSGNLAGIAVSFCVIAVWCFFKERFVPAGILCLAVSLVTKPQDAGLVWLFFLIGGASFKKRAVQTFVVALVLSLPAVLWVSHISPDWMQELHANLVATSAHGDIRDPGPTASSIHELEIVIDLQSVISIFHDDPRIYNPASYLICGTFLLVWTIRTLRSRSSPARNWIALAAIVPLTMLVSYHRPYDAKLLLLTVPACALLWAEGGRTAWAAVLINTAAILLTGDIPLAVLLVLTDHLHLSTGSTLGKIMTIVLLRPATLILLAISIFYLCVLIRRTSDSYQSTGPVEA
jgi:hypothetical protein